MKKLLFISLLSLAIVSCSSPKSIVLTDGSVIKTSDEPKFKKKLDVYEYEDIEGNKGTVNASNVKLIQPIDAEIPEAPKVEEIVPVPVTLPAESVEEPVEQTEAEPVEEEVTTE